MHQVQFVNNLCWALFSCHGLWDVSLEFPCQVELGLGAQFLLLIISFALLRDIYQSPPPEVLRRSQQAVFEDNQVRRGCCSFSYLCCYLLVEPIPTLVRTNTLPSPSMVCWAPGLWVVTLWDLAQASRIVVTVCRVTSASLREGEPWSRRVSHWMEARGEVLYLSFFSTVQKDLVFEVSTNKGSSDPQGRQQKQPAPWHMEPQQLSANDIRAVDSTANVWIKVYVLTHGAKREF